MIQTYGASNYHVNWNQVGTILVNNVLVFINNSHYVGIRNLVHN